MNLIAHVEIPVENLERAIQFYSAVLGIAFSDIVTLHGARMAYFPFTEGWDGASGALAEGEAYKPTSDGMIVYLAVDDIDAAITRAVQLGSSIVFPRTELDDGTAVAEIADSEGNRIALQSIRQ